MKNRFLFFFVSHSPGLFSQCIIMHLKKNNNNNNKLCHLLYRNLGKVQYSLTARPPTASITSVRRQCLCVHREEIHSLILFLALSFFLFLPSRVAINRRRPCQGPHKAPTRPQWAAEAFGLMTRHTPES